MPRRAIGGKPMTPTERSARRRNSQAEEIRVLRNALIDALVVFDIGEDTKFREAYADVIKRAWSVKNAQE